MSKFFTWLRYITAGVLMIIISVVFFALMIPLLPWRNIRVLCCNAYGKTAGRIMFTAIGARPVIHNRQNLRAQFPAIFVSNHTSQLDIWVGMWLCPFGVAGLSKKEIVQVPGLGWLYLLSGHPLIDRSNRERAIATMNDVATFLINHRFGLWIWPEGTRSRTGELQPFKKGFAHAALATRLPIVPIVVWNAARIMPIHEFRFHPGKLPIDVLPPIDTSQWAIETLDEHVQAVREVFLQRLEAGAPA
jgi:1-acyl-sn-glycerol-3-phosphate acyltransferase